MCALNEEKGMNLNMVKKIFDKVDSPCELLNFMSENINYGYLGKSGRVYHYDDNDFNNKWFDDYMLESEEDILKTLYGNCWDQVELERYWFEKNGYEVKTIYQMVKLDYNNNYPTHSFLIFRDKEGGWNWFENSDFENRGIHKFDSIDELLKYQYNKYLEFLRTFNISDDEINKIIFTEFTKPNSNISASDYLEFVINSTPIFIKEGSDKNERKQNKY